MESGNSAVSSVSGVLEDEGAPQAGRQAGRQGGGALYLIVADGEGMMADGGDEGGGGG